MTLRAISLFLLSVVSVRADDTLAEKLRKLDSQAVPVEARSEAVELAEEWLDKMTVSRAAVA